MLRIRKKAFLVTVFVMTSIAFTGCSNHKRIGFGKQAESVSTASSDSVSGTGAAAESAAEMAESLPEQVSGSVGSVPEDALILADSREEPLETDFLADSDDVLIDDSDDVLTDDSDDVLIDDSDDMNDGGDVVVDEGQPSGPDSKPAAVPSEDIVPDAGDVVVDDGETDSVMEQYKNETAASEFIRPQDEPGKDEKEEVATGAMIRQQVEPDEEEVSDEDFTGKEEVLLPEKTDEEIVHPETDHTSRQDSDESEPDVIIPDAEEEESEPAVIVSEAEEAESGPAVVLSEAEEAESEPAVIVSEAEEAESGPDTAVSIPEEASEMESEAEYAVTPDEEGASLAEHVRGIRDFSVIEGMKPDVLAGISWDETILRVEPDTNGVNWDKSGTQTLRYLITAADGRQEIVSVHVRINPDLDLALYGMEGNVTIKPGETFDPMENVSWSSEIASVTADTSGLDSNTPGIYLISYTLTAPDGRTQSTVRQITVADSTFNGYTDDYFNAVKDYSSVTDLGLWRLTAYMDTPEDQGPYVGQTASGAPLIPGRTVAVSQATCARLGLKFGDHLMIDGHIYVLEDYGGSAMNDQNWVDIFVDNPQDEFSDRFNRFTEVYLLR